VQLQFSTWPDIERYLKHSSGLIVPIGSTEQHGPTGLIGTDALCAEAIAQGVSERFGVLIAPTLSLGVAQFNLAFAGTLSIRARTLMMLVDDLVQSLLRHGFKRIYFLNGHGGNSAPLRALFQDLYQPYSLRGEDCPFRCRLRSWWDYPQTNALRQQYFGQYEGLHATPSEIAITQAVWPDSIHTQKLDPVPVLSAEFVRERGGDNHFDATDHRREFPDGRLGSDPNLATPELGRKLLDTAVAEAHADYQSFLTC